MISLEGQVLIAEDDENDAFLIQRAFSKSGFTRMPHICRDGLETIAYLEGKAEFADRQRFPFPRVLVTDLKMPRFNGFELLQWAREHPEFLIIPTIVMSSSDDPSDVKYAYCLGANAYLTKPSSAREMQEAIQSFLTFWKHCQTPALTGVPSCRELAQKRGQSGQGLKSP